MPRPNPSDPKEGQDALFGPPPLQKPNAGGKMSGGLPEGETTAALRRSLEFARSEGDHTPMDEGSGAVLLAYGRAVDGAIKHGAPYVLGKIGQPLVELLGAMHMTPDSREDTTGSAAIDELIRELAEADDDTASADG